MVSVLYWIAGNSQKHPQVQYEGNTEAGAPGLSGEFAHTFALESQSPLLGQNQSLITIQTRKFGKIF